MRAASLVIRITAVLALSAAGVLAIAAPGSPALAAARTPSAASVRPAGYCYPAERTDIELFAFTGPHKVHDMEVIVWNSSTGDSESGRRIDLYRLDDGLRRWGYTNRDGEWFAIKVSSGAWYEAYTPGKGEECAASTSFVRA
jgi:hypothetical protein